MSRTHPPQAAAATDPGRERSNNEDRVLCEPDLGIFAVIDGVGGESAGEVAAETALEVLRARLSRRTTDSARLVREAIALANRQIYERASADARLAGMSCVLTVAVLDGAKVTVGQVGDSRLYTLAPGEIRKVTPDHSPVGAREDAGDLSELEAMRHPRRNEIFRDVGSGPHEPDDARWIDVLEVPFDAGGALLLCSDGLSDMVPSQEILETVESYAASPRAAVRALIERANSAGGRDNVSAVLVEGERFAEAVRRRRDGSARDGGGRAGRAAAATPSPRGAARTAPTSLAPGSGSGSGRSGAAWVRSSAADRLKESFPALLGKSLLVVALLLLAAFAAYHYREPLVRWMESLAGRSPDSRGGAGTAGVLVVGTGDGGFATIGEALAQARPGETIEVAPGQYRERIALRSGVSLVSRTPRGATLLPPPPEPAGTPGTREEPGGGAPRGPPPPGPRPRGAGGRRARGHRERGPRRAPGRVPDRGHAACAARRGHTPRRLRGGGRRGRGHLCHRRRDREPRRRPFDRAHLLRPSQRRPRHRRRRRRRAAAAVEPDLRQRRPPLCPGAGSRGAGGGGAAARRQPHRGQRRPRRRPAGAGTERGGLPLEQLRGGASRAGGAGRCRRRGRHRSCRRRPRARRPHRRRAAGSPRGRARIRWRGPHGGLPRAAEAPMTLPLLGQQQTVGRFEVKDFLGRGAIGDVLLSWDPREERLVALKVVRTAKTDPEMLEAEKNGLSLQAQLAAVAPQVAAVYEQGQDGEFFWVAMEYVAGTDLSEVLARGALPEAQAVEVALELVSMLKVCHEFSAEVGGRRILGIVHGDIKPENIRLQDGDRVRVLDFGIAKHLSQTRRFTVNLFGSLPYTPPERLERGVVDRHSDLWAVGVVLAAMVLGRRPFPGNTPEELEQAIRHGVPPLPLPAGCSPGLSHVVDKSLAFEVSRRYQTAAELEADLLALRDGQPLPQTAAADGSAPDLHATRRTTRPLSPEEVRAAEATRRTDRTDRSEGADQQRAPRLAADGAAAAGLLGLAAAGANELTAAAAVQAVGPPAPAVPAGMPAALPAPRPRRRSRRLLTMLLVVALLAFGVSQLWAWNQAKQLRRDLAEVRPDLDAIAQRYDQVATWSWLSTDLFGVGEELQRSLTASAARILDSYHGDDPTTSQRGWETAYRYLHAAAQLAPRDRGIRARMLYAHAHLDRLASLAARGKGDRQQSLALSKDAVAEFQEASRLDPNWPDPYLGLARIYAYDLFDLDALQKTLDELTRRGYQLGRREKAMLADAFRMRGLALEARGQRAHGTSGETDLLEQARDDLEQAVQTYAEIPGFGAAASNREEAESHLESIQERLSQHPQRHPPGFWERLRRALTRELRRPGG
jgi:serine/threonine protein phosphatase PrpC/serine/threonine protein kinase